MRSAYYLQLLMQSILLMLTVQISDQLCHAITNIPTLQLNHDNNDLSLKG